MACRFVHRDLVQFSDTDMAGIMHFANFFRFMERAEHAFFRSLGYSIMERRELVPLDQRVGWPRVHASCDYISPLRFEDEVDIEVLVDEIRTRSLRYLFRVRKADGTLAAEGKIAVVCVRKDPETRQMKAVAIPQHILDKIEVAPEEMRRSPRGP
ncbi:MAG TPA: thioesterase family protein, partial [Verrucomicrobium sp.]|nr:thioesterase family protein [Verrucomicrobium sp.]